MNDILTLHSTAADVHIESKKSALDLISKLASAHIKTMEPRLILTALIKREKLGSTAVGHGVALPHARIKGIEKPIGILITLNKGVDFDAPDDEPVDLLFGLLIPEDATDEHLEILSMLATRFDQGQYRQKLRGAFDNDSLFKSAIH